MTTITTDETAPSADSDGLTAEQPTARPRRFAPRRSRAGALTAIHEDSATATEQAPVVVSDSAGHSADTVVTPTINGESDADVAPHAVIAPPTTAGRSRRGRNRRPLADVSATQVEAPAPPDDVSEVVPDLDTPILTGGSSEAQVVDASAETETAVSSLREAGVAQPSLVGEPAGGESLTGSPTVRRPSPRRGSRRGPAPTADAREGRVSGTNQTSVGEVAGVTKSPATRRARPARPTPAARQVEAPLTAIADVEETSELISTVADLSVPTVGELSTEPNVTVAESTPERIPAVAESTAVAETDVVPALTAEGESRFGSELADLFGMTTREAAAATADLEGADLLARALREMFPPIDDAGAAKTGASPDDNLPVFDFEAAAAAFEAVLDALPDADDGGEDDEGGEADDGPELAEDNSEEAQRRRSRRGRRGGRGRRRNGLVMLPSPADGEPVAAEPVPIRPDIAATPPALPPPTPISAQPDPTPMVRTAEAAPASPFTPEDPPRSETNWRDQRPRRNWGKPAPRETARTEMPPPKPSSTRFIPIPQAAPPPATVSLQAPAVAPSTPFTMPDLRTDEPLGPGETRSERLLQVQTRLMAAMLEQQARQIDVLTAGVSALYQALQGLGGGVGGSRANLPRTGIFVDAPNVVYAADNARVSIDYGRMLKYLSRDRQLVHALSYSPIIDDIREGIRYETQRFVAPFLRAGYKLITKPLKRFSDGSAKGNFDIELALDILTMAERLDIVVLVSGDSDFESVIEHIQSQGVRVEVVAFASNVSTELVNVADTFIDISQHLEHMRPL